MPIINELVEKYKGKLFNFDKDLTAEEKDALLLACKNDNNEAIDIVFNGHEKLLYSIINTKCSLLLSYNVMEEDEIFNIFRNEFLRILKIYDQSKGEFKSYLCATLFGSSKNLVNKADNSGEFNKIALDASISHDSKSSDDFTLLDTLSSNIIENYYFDDELLEKYALEKCLSLMPEYLRNVIVEYFYNQKNLGEIANQINVSNQAVSVRKNLALDLFAYIYKMDIDSADFSMAKNSKEVTEITKANEKLLGILKEIDFKSQIYPELLEDERAMVKIYFPGVYIKAGIKDNTDTSAFVVGRSLPKKFNSFFDKLEKIVSIFKVEDNETVLKKYKEYGLYGILTPLQKTVFQHVFVEGKSIAEVDDMYKTRKTNATVALIKRNIVVYERNRAKVNDIINSVGGEEVIAKDLYAKLDEIDKEILTNIILAYMPITYESVAKEFNTQFYTIKSRAIALRRDLDRFIREKEKGKEFFHETRKDSLEKKIDEISKKCKKYGLVKGLTSMQRQVFDLVCEDKISPPKCAEKLGITIFEVHNNLAYMKGKIETYERRKKTIKKLISNVGGEEGKAVFYDSLDDVDKAILTEIILAQKPTEIASVAKKYHISKTCISLRKRKLIQRLNNFASTRCLN